MTDFYHNPLYLERAPFYRLYRDLYEGIHATLVDPEYLWVHDLEAKNHQASKDLRRRREQRTRYRNLIEPIVSRYISIFFKKEPQPDDKVKKLFGDGINDVTGTGKSLVTFLKEDVTGAALVSGRPIILTDTYDESFPNLKAQRDAKARPYFEIIPALDLKDWELGKDGKFKWLRYEYSMIESRSGADKAPQEGVYSKVFTQGKGVFTVEVYRGKKKDSAGAAQSAADLQQKTALRSQQDFCSDYEWELKNSKTLPGEIPVRTIEGSESWIKDTAQQALKLYNLESSRDSILYFQAYQRIFFIGVTQEEQKKALSEYTVGFLPDGASVDTIEPVSTASLDENIARTTESIYQIAFNQNRQVAADSKAVEGASTQSENKEQLITLIVSEIEALENLTNQAVRDYAAALGQQNFDGKVTFNRDINIDDVSEQISLFMQLRGDISKYPLWYKESLKKFPQYQKLGDVTADVVKEIDTTAKKIRAEAQQQEKDALDAAINGKPKAAA